MPLVITGSQADWLEPEQFSRSSFKARYGSLPARKQLAQCAIGQRDRDGPDCNTFKERDPRTRGKNWASLRRASLTELDIETLSDFLEVQVRPRNQVLCMRDQRANARDLQ